MVDEFITIHRDPKYAANNVIKIRTEQVRACIRRDPRAPILHLTLEEGAILELRRIDGRMAPIRISVDEGEHTVVYEVDHAGYRQVVD